MGKFIVNKVIPKVYSECDLIAAGGVGLAIGCLVGLTILLIVI
jgi:hypothetical protein